MIKETPLCLVFVADNSEAGKWSEKPLCVLIRKRPPSHVGEAPVNCNEGECTMRRVWAALCVAVMCGVSLPVSAEEVQKYRVAVSDLVISDLVPAKQAEILKGSSLIADIENAIRNGRKFELLTRRESAMAAIRKEQEFAKSDLAAGDAASEGNISNAQSLVQVEVLQFSFGRSASRVPNIDNKYRVSDHCSLELSVQIIDTERASVVASFPVKASTSTGSSIVNGVGGASRSVLDQTLEKAAGTLANMLSDTVFPIQVITVKGKQLWINRGNDSGMKMGEVFDVFEPGEELVDPQTGESLGTTEMEIGQAKVTRINPKVTVVEMIKGEPSEVQPGYILRRPVKTR